VIDGGATMEICRRVIDVARGPAKYVAANLPPLHVYVGTCKRSLWTCPLMIKLPPRLC